MKVIWHERKATLKRGQKSWLSPGLEKREYWKKMLSACDIHIRLDEMDAHSSIITTCRGTSSSYLIKIIEGISLHVFCVEICIVAIVSSGDLYVPVWTLISTPALRVVTKKSQQTALISAPPDGKDFLVLTSTLQFQSEQMGLCEWSSTWLTKLWIIFTTVRKFHAADK